MKGPVEYGIRWDRDHAEKPRKDDDGCRVRGGYEGDQEDDAASLRVQLQWEKGLCCG